MAPPSIVIKVKYGETLRRFTLVKGDQDQHLQLNIEELRAKIRSLFSFPLDANFTLTYTDEDGDQVTLANNEDLHDVVIQGLNPVRITVLLDSSDDAFSCRSSDQTLQNLDPTVADALKYSKSAAELALKAVSSNHVVTDIVEKVSKMVEALRNPPRSRSGTESVTSPIPPYLFFQKVKDIKTQCSEGISGINNDVGLRAFNGKHKDNDSFKACLERCEDSSSSPRIGVPRHFGPEPFDGNFYNANGMESVFHKGISCNGCGVMPITGPRFKSIVNLDYDLCNICFTRLGNYSDYIRIDFPSPKRHLFKGFHDAASPLLNPNARLNQLIPRLDSRLINDDNNVIDGTIMAPLTPFTKIWRMQNSGSLPWSHGLQLLWIGGGLFGSPDSIKIEVPNNGVDVGNEIDVAVNFTAPELPGKYISIWRLADSWGHQFGQHLLVLIQVDPSLKDDNSTCESSINPNPVVKEETVTEDRNHEIIDIVDMNIPINDPLTGGYEVSCAASASLSSSVSPPVCTKGKNEADNSNSEDQNEQKNADEESLLNEEVVQGHEYDDIDKSVDELCIVSGWDPILQELQEMGFNDKVMNKKLLEENNGSITRTVMDLVSRQEG